MDSTIRRPLALRSLIAALLVSLVPLGLAGARAADETATPDDDRVVAIVFEREVKLSDLRIPDSAVEGMRASKSDAEFNEWMETQQSRILNGLIFKVLSNAYMQENGVTASEDEINAFLQQEKDAYNKVMNKYVETLREYQHQAEEIFATGKPVPADLQAKIDDMKKKIEVLERKSTKNMVFSDKQRQLQEDVRRERVSNAIRAWKFNRLLHEQYGGRVKAEKDNLTYVPFEAYAAWLQGEEKLGHFQITDPKLREDFWAYYNSVPENPIEPFPGMWDQLRWVGNDMP